MVKDHPFAFAHGQREENIWGKLLYHGQIHKKPVKEALENPPELHLTDDITHFTKIALPKGTSVGCPVITLPNHSSSNHPSLNMSLPSYPWLEFPSF